MNNPFTLNFGKEPQSSINRTFQENEIIEEFTSENPAYQVCMITGVRGSGKTVALTSISRKINERDDWFVIDLNPERPMLKQMAAELCGQTDFIQIFKDAKLNLSFFGVGIELGSEQKITDEVVDLEKMLEKLTAKNKKILVTVDEVVSSQNIREFVSQFQIFMRRNFNVFLLMTGLYENIYELQNEKTLTFLYRAPKLELKPLNKTLIASKYKEIFNLEETSAREMADLTKGYPFAFQALGYLCWKNQTDWKSVLTEFDAILEDFVYEKIWSELSDKDHDVILAICRAKDSKIESIRMECNMDSSNFSVYRNRLLKKGIVFSPNYGKLDFTLPRFKEFSENRI